MVDERDPGADSELRRRAAWLLAMIAVVAVLFVLVLTQLSSGSGKQASHDTNPGPLDGAVGSTTASPTPGSRAPSSSSRPPSTASSSSNATSAAAGSLKCPTRQTCILDGDPGNGIAAINDYRTQHGQPTVTGRVSPQAQRCAFRNGNDCSGGWAETELAKPDGAEAVQKMLAFARVLDPAMKGFEVGWAYDPRAELYYFAIIRND